MKKILNNRIIFSFLIIISIYLFVSAPQPLENVKKQGVLIPIETALKLIDQENALIREMYTREIVGFGKKQGLKFDEDWQKEEVHAGLLPAQFLRATAEYLQRSDVPIGLFLGSDHAINKSNVLEGLQLTQFIEMKKNRLAKFSYIADIQRYSYMSPDIASVKPCVSCHNKHKQSPKTDWKLNDVMGATTWIYPDKFVTFDELLKMIATLHAGANYAYKQVLSELVYFRGNYTIAKKWPRQGKFIPNEEAFSHEVLRITAPVTISSIEKLVSPPLTTVASN